MSKDMRRGDGDAVPFPTTSERAYAGVLTREQFDKEVERAPVREIPLDRVVATQTTIDPKVVMRFASDSPPKVPEGKRNFRGLLIDKPIVVKRGGSYYLHDGHHRLSAEKWKGNAVGEARVVDTEESSLSKWASSR